MVFSEVLALGEADLPAFSPVFSMAFAAVVFWPASGVSVGLVLASSLGLGLAAVPPIDRTLALGLGASPPMLRTLAPPSFVTAGWGAVTAGEASVVRFAIETAGAPSALVARGAEGCWACCWPY